MSQINFEAVREWFYNKTFEVGTWHEQTLIDGKTYDIVVTVKPDRTVGIKIEVIDND